MKVVTVFLAISALTGWCGQTLLDIGKDSRVGGVILRGAKDLYVVGGANVQGDHQIMRLALDGRGVPVSSKPAGCLSAKGAGGVAAAISGKWLFASGGDLKDVTVRLTIREDGSLADCVELPNGDRPAFASAGMVASGKYLVIGGGWQSRLCYAAEICSDGSLGPWMKQRPLPSICFCNNRMFRLGNRIYAAGNQVYNGATDRVFATEVAGDGAVTKWRRWAELPECAPHFVFSPMPDGKGVFYCNLDSQAMYVASIVRDGEIGDWRKLAAAFPEGPYVSLVGLPLAGGKYLRYSMLIDVPRIFKPADLIDID